MTDQSSDYSPTDAPDGIEHVCLKCGQFFNTTEEIKFCSHCGGAVKVLRGKKHRVLLMDDSAITRKKVGAILRQMGCEVVEAEDAQEGLPLAQKDKFDLIVLDIQMPVMNGLEVLATLRKDARFADQAIVMLTVEADVSLVRQAITMGATDYIRKDLPLAQLKERFGKHIT